MTAMRLSSRPAAALETTSHNLAGGCRVVDQWEARNAREQQSPISCGCSHGDRLRKFASNGSRNQAHCRSSSSLHITSPAPVHVKGPAAHLSSDVICHYPTTRLPTIYPAAASTSVSL